MNPFVCDFGQAYSFARNCHIWSLSNRCISGLCDKLENKSLFEICVEKKINYCLSLFHQLAIQKSIRFAKIRGLNFDMLYGEHKSEHRIYDGCKITWLIHLLWLCKFAMKARGEEGKQVNIRPFRPYPGGNSS